MNGTMSALALDQLAERVRRGQAGNIRAGKAAGGLPFGYRIRYLNDNGQFEPGLREIDPDQAQVVKRIYADFLAGQKPLEIARRLNEDGISSPRGILWTAITISGHYGRDNGILQNPIYKGEMIWNRNNFDRHPVTGIRHVRQNNPSEWVVHSSPDLQIIPDDDWEKVQQIIEQQRQKSGRSHRKRQHYPDIGIKVICARCKNSMNKHSPKELICGAWKRTRTCSQNKKIDTKKLCDALYTHLRNEFDTVWAQWCRHAERENIRRQEQRTNRSKSSMLHELLTLDEVSRDVFFQALETAQRDPVSFVQRILKAATIDTDSHATIFVHATEPDWDALAKI